jgi:hypothetical protein
MKKSLFIAVLGLVVLRVSNARAQTASEPVDRKSSWNVAAGYGFSLHLHGAGTDEKIAVFEPGISLRLGSRFEYVAAGHFAHFFSPSGYLIGLVPLGARFYAGRGAILPYVSIGTGFGWTDLEINELTRRFNFLVQGSLGLRRALSSGEAWSFEARISHISNGGTREPNTGHNAVVFLVGLRPR